MYEIDMLLAEQSNVFLPLRSFAAVLRAMARREMGRLSIVTLVYTRSVRVNRSTDNTLDTE